MELLHTPQQRPASWTLRLKRFLPRSLFGRMLLILILPTFLMLTVATYVFFNRHWYTVTQRMANALVGDVAVLVSLLDEKDAPDKNVTDLIEQKLRLVVAFDPNADLPSPPPSPRGPIAVILKHALNERLPYPYALNMNAAEKTIGIQVKTPKGVYTVLCSEKRVYTPTTSVFILWMTGSSILLTFVALLFMRNQIRPILRLAAAAEAIGKGRDVPWFKVEGSTEVRQAGAALMVMRDRLKRQIAQRTAMLAGVSHDLRTPLTRMRLQIELMGVSPDTEELLSDVAEMEEMLNAYLAFARGEEAEPSIPIDLGDLLNEVVLAARRQNPDITLNVSENVTIIMRHNAIKRCLTNLIGNALRYGSRAAVCATASEKMVTITIDDDGPGIPPTLREEMFRPFTRAEESRNQATGGVGLGLTIARDIARAHGGDVLLEDSPLGGLRARIWLPL
ncbi:MAG: ATP-binding protein [Alphaproteobacteria bacterium]|nr:ATP-binding protein [Alphaproteobacteria bacterium]